GHYGELLARDKVHKIDVLFSPMIYSLPSYLDGHVLASLACPRVMAAPENIKAGFLKETDVFAEHGVRHVAPLVSLGDAPLVAKQLYTGLYDALPGLTLKETRYAVEAGYRALETFGADLRARPRAVLARCAATYSPVQQIVELSGTLFFSFQDLDSTKPAGSVKIRVETIAHYLQKYGAGIVAKKMAAAPAGCPLLDR